MFSNAYDTVKNFTRPVIFSRRFHDGRVSSGCGTFIVVNSDGWIATAAHIIGELKLYETHMPEVADYNAQKAAIEADSGLKPSQKRKRVARLNANPKWVINQAIMWGSPKSVLVETYVDRLADLAIGRLEPFDPKGIEGYPTFKDPSQPMPYGTSLCRLGYPFHEIRASFDEATSQFQLDPSVFPIPRFPNDGIHTRVVVVAAQDGSRTVKFIETSSPGLMGQSGGPVFDQHGHIWAIQSSTHCLPLGFSPSVQAGNQRIVEHQFMHLGRCSHVEELIRMMKENKVAFNLSGG